jgi:glycine/D-amino acid oxidase-like deaminating enzyme
MAGALEKADVLIVGGGLAGCACAYFLAREGADVLLIERSDLNTLASGSNAGSIHAQIPHLPFVEEGEAWARTFAPTIPLLLRSIRLWQELPAMLGEDLDVSMTGGLLVARSQAQLRDVARKAAIEREQGMEIRLLTRDELRSLAPYVSKEMAGGAFAPEEGRANPLKATPAFARAAQMHGARIRRRTELIGLERDGTGFLASTSRGRIAARRVVNAAGAAAGEVARHMGLGLPILAEPIQVSVTEPLAPLVKHLLYYAGDRLTLKQVANGSCLIGGGWPATVLEATGRPAVSLRSLRDNMRVALEVVPALGGARILRTWPAIVNGTADWKPILGELPGVRGFFMCFIPWLGFSAGPIAARTVAELVLGREPEADLSHFSARRFE